jgi:heterodisulfide reductase subunit B
MYLTELIGVAFQHPRVRSWFEKHMVSPQPVMARKGFV